MATVTFRGNPVELAGRFPGKGEKAPALKLTTADLSEATLDNFAGKAKVLNIFPSIDTPTCAASVRKFNEKAAGREGTVVLCISADLPFAQKRFCSAENLNNVLTLSTFRNLTFLEAYGVKLASGPLRGLATRAVLVLDANNNILHSQLVSEIGCEPNYDAALSVL